MKLSVSNSQRIYWALFGGSITIWVILFYNPGNLLKMEHCNFANYCPSSGSLQLLLALNPFSSRILAWGLMVLAMMLPKLILPIEFIYQQSLKRNRSTNALLFVLGYLFIWMNVGLFMVGVILFCNLYFPMLYSPAIFCFIVAVIWQFSPFKQHFLNMGHQHPILATFGLAAKRDALFFGLKHGVWCVGSGWALMLFPMLMPFHHHLAMLVVTFLMVSEHLESPAVPRWSINLSLKLIKIVVGQARIKWQKMKLIVNNVR